MSKQFNCDGIMDCDAMVLLNGGDPAAPECLRVNTEGNITYAFPEGEKPPGKFTQFDFGIVPWVSQGKRGTPLPADVTESANGPKEVYKQQLTGSAEAVLDGQNVVVTSYGHDQSQKFPLMFGDSKGSKGLLRLFLDELFAAQHAEMHHISLSAHVYTPYSGEVVDIVTDKDNEAALRDGDAKRAGSDVVGLVAAFLNKTNYVEECNKLWARVQRERQRVADANDDKCVELALKPPKNSGKGEGDALDLGFDEPKADADAMKSHIPEPYYDQLISVSVQTYTSEQTCLQDRASTQWGSAQFLILPDTSRPPCVGVLDTVDVRRYEQVQKVLCGVMSVLTAIRLKRRRVPFLAHKYTSTLRTVFRQTGERESEMRMIRNASFRAKNWEGAGPESPSSPRFKGKPANPTRAVVLLHLSQKYNAQENYHAFTLVKRFVEMGSASHTGSLTRHLATEMQQMEREVASLALQLDLAKAMHNYRPMLYNVETKGSKTIKEREQAALEKKATLIERLHGERRDRIEKSAQHIADRNITEMESRVAQVQQNVSNLQADRDRTHEELMRWKNMTTASLDKEIADLNNELAMTERKLAAAETEQTTLKKKVKAKHEEVADFAARLRDNERKVVEEFERRAKQHKAEVEQRRVLTGQHIAELRGDVEAAGAEVAAAADQLKKCTPSAGDMCANIKEGIAGLAPLLPRIMPSEHPSDDMRARIAQVTARLQASWAHEMFFLQRELRENNIPLPVDPAAVTRPNMKLDDVRPVVRVHLTVVGVEGLNTKTAGMKYSVSLQRRFDVHETMRMPMKKATDRSVTWNYKFKLATRLPPKGETRVDLVPMTLSEFLPDGSFSEALPFDVDLLSMACKPPQHYIVVPCPGSDLKIRIHASTYRAKPTQAIANPLCTAAQIAQRRPMDVDYGPSSDDEY